jgi:hypothetical protein
LSNDAALIVKIKQVNLDEDLGTRRGSCPQNRCDARARRTAVGRTRSACNAPRYDLSVPVWSDPMSVNSRGGW